MRKLVTWVLVTVGIAALVKRWRRRQAETVEEPSASVTGSDPADALRQKLAESRTEGAREAGDAGSAGVDERRAEVHAEGRAAVDEMQASTED